MALAMQDPISSTTSASRTPEGMDHRRVRQLLSTSDGGQKLDAYQNTLMTPTRASSIDGSARILRGLSDQRQEGIAAGLDGRIARKTKDGGRRGASSR